MGLEWDDNEIMMGYATSFKYGDLNNEKTWG